MKKDGGYNHPDNNLKTEIIAGITIFMAAMYIIVVNPSILSDAGMPFSGVLTATVLVSAFSSIAMGLYARNPILVAPGMGLNAFFAYTVVQGMQVSWQIALGAVFWSGVIFILLSVFNIRTHILNAIPKQIRYGVAAGIGLFITLIGFLKSGFIITPQSGYTARAIFTPQIITFLTGLALTSILLVRQVKGAMLLGIVFTTLISIPLGRLYGIETIVEWKGFWDAPDLSLLFSLDLINSLKFSMIPVIFAFLFTDMFDSLSTFVGVAEAGGLIDKNGEPRRIKESLIVDGAATTLAALFGSSPGTSYIESAAGIEEGGKSGIPAIVAGILFLPFMFFSPLLSIIPEIATAPVLILVGIFMIRPILKINWLQMDDAIPAFLAILLIPLTYSITQGIIWGFLSWTLLKLVTGKFKEIPLALWIIDIFCIIALVLY
ncbi:MAG: NCS2 family permease [Calditrichaceae bacterium]|nr:NCS2 family permease [Calditrichaceae bacterium]